MANKPKKVPIIPETGYPKDNELLNIEGASSRLPEFVEEHGEQGVGESYTAHHGQTPLAVFLDKTNPDIQNLAAFLISTFPAEIEAHPEESPVEIAIRIMSAPQKAVSGPVDESSYMKRWKAKYGG